MIPLLLAFDEPVVAAFVLMLLFAALSDLPRSAP